MKSNSPIYWTGSKAAPDSRIYLSEVSGPHVLYVSGGVANKAAADHLANCWNACHGLDLPADVPPGVLAELVTTATTYCDAKATQDREMGTPGPLSVSRQTRRKLLLEATQAALAGLERTLAKLTPAAARLVEHPTEDVNLAAPNQQAKGFVLRPSKE